MRILLAHNSLYYPSHGGGDRSNRLLMEALAARGHSVRVAARIVKFGPEPHEQFLRDLAARGIQPRVEDKAAHFELNGVGVHTLTLDTAMRTFFAAQVSAFDPDVILTSTDDPAQLLFEVAIRAARARVVHLVRATIAVPFGPDASAPSPARTERLRQADLIVGVSEYVARYVREHGHMDAVHVPISLMEPSSQSPLGHFENPYITLANPCAVKGIGIFTGLAQRMPHLRFAAVPTWGTNAADFSELRRLPNITILEPFDNVDDLLRLTRVLLVPSVWAEARSRIVVEAMMRGVPVIASDIGGIPEAKLGVPYLIPVRPIVNYKAAVDENMVPIPEVPPQDLEPWQVALDRLTSDATHWDAVADASRRAALAYADSLSIHPFENLLLDAVAKPKHADFKRMPLSPEKQRLLSLRWKHKAWFPIVHAPAKLRLFCFPHAGAGALAYRSWSGMLGPEVDVSPAQLPGRESRIAEPTIESMPELIDALSAAIRPHLDVPFAFFGHSMGAGIAFELARRLRSNGAPMPRSLHVSGARAPQYRLHWTPPPEPADSELMAQIPPEAAGLALPVLRADTRLYRNYQYVPAAPLDLPLFAYGGLDDEGVPHEHLLAWAEQTTSTFILHEFKGGHFYLQSEESFLEVLRADLRL